MLSTSRCSENPPITDAEKVLPTQRDVDPFLIAVTSDASGTVVALSEAAADAMLADTNPDFITTAVSHPDGVVLTRVSCSVSVSHAVVPALFSCSSSQLVP
jgi:hypothetical protein